MRVPGNGGCRGEVFAGRVPVLFFCAAIALCEWVFSFCDVSWGVALALGLAVLMFCYVSLAGPSPAAADSIDALALLPLYILFTSSLPWFFLDRDMLLPAVYLIILGLCAWYAFQKGLSPGDVGLRAGWMAYSLFLGVVVGLPAGLAESYIIDVRPPLPVFELPYLLRDFFYMTFFVGFGEELLFRGIIQRELSRLMGSGWGLLLASIMFGVMHLTWRSAAEVAYTALVGLVLGCLYRKTGSLMAPVVAHGVGNTVLVGVVPYLR